MQVHVTDSNLNNKPALNIIYCSLDMGINVELKRTHTLSKNFSSSFLSLHLYIDIYVTNV